MTERGKRKIRKGKVVGDRADKTIAVEVERRYRHPLYGKEMKSAKKVLVHDEDNSAGVGDDVEIMETRPISRSKHWRLVEITSKAVK